MYLSVLVNERLPPLVWCAAIKRGEERIDLICGRSVETERNSFIEGAWDRDFASKDFDQTPNMFGSGGRLRGNEIVFVPPGHNMESLFYTDHQNVLRISNSLCFLLAASRQSLDISYMQYQLDMRQILCGLEKFHVTIPTNHDPVHIIYWKNMVIGTDCSPEFSKKPSMPSFSSFFDYYTTLTDTVRRVLENSKDQSRRNIYRPICTLSSGYDSTACAVILRSLGCNETILFRTERAPNQPSDSGEVVARILGMQFHTFPFDAYVSRTDFPEAEFLATGMSGAEVILTAAENCLRDSILFTGQPGGDIWGKTPKKMLKRSDSGFHGLGEFRCRINCIHAPIPFIGALNYDDITAIANSPEMEIYSVGGLYDRPIPRRIIEEKGGIPRNLFAQQKLAPPKFRISERSKQDFATYAAKYDVHSDSKSAATQPGSFIQVPLRFLMDIEQRHKFLLNFPQIRDYIKDFAKGYIGRIRQTDPVKNILFFWAIDKTIGRYAEPLQLDHQS